MITKKLYIIYAQRRVDILFTWLCIFYDLTNVTTLVIEHPSPRGHGDGEKALQFVKRIREKLQEKQIQVKLLHVIFNDWMEMNTEEEEKND